MRWIVLLLLSLTVVFGIDYKHMFFTSEPINGYSLEVQEPPKKPKTKRTKKTNTEATVENGTTLPPETNGANMDVTALLGFQSQKGYDRMGSSITAAITKPMPQLIQALPDLFFQAEYTLGTKPLRDTMLVLPEIKNSLLGGYAGYAYQANEKTLLKGKVGLALFTQPESTMALAYGVAVVRKIAVEEVELVGDITVAKELWLICAGVRYKLPAQ